MAGTTYSTSVLTGITLSDTGTQDPATIAAGIYVTNGGTGNAVYGTSAAAWRLVNLGTIQANSTAWSGVVFEDGGTVINGTKTATSALIEGATGIKVFSQPGTVQNFGTITGIDGAAVWLADGGRVTNLNTLENIGDFAAVTVGNSGTGAGTVTNSGAIVATGTGSTGVWLIGGGDVDNQGAIEAGDQGVVVDVGGTVTNGRAGLTTTLIEGGSGVNILGAGSLANFGTVISTATAGQVGVHIAKGGVVTNGTGGSTKALITAYRDGIYIGGTDDTIYPGAAGTVTNFGTIRSQGTDFSAVSLAIGGTVVNEQHGLLSGSAGVTVKRAVGTIRNFGTIESTSNIGIYLGAGGRITNGTKSVTAAKISSNDQAIFTDGNATITNYGLVVSSGTSNSAVFVDYGGGRVTNFGTIESTGSDAVHVAKGTVINEAGALIQGDVTGVIIGGPGTGQTYAGAGVLTNFGTIRSVATGTVGDAVLLQAGGKVTNEKGGLITGGRPGSSAGGYPGAVTAENKRVTVDNLGTITNSDNGNGINLLSGGTVVNGSKSATAALVSGSADGIYMGGTSGTPTTGAYGVVNNYGTIENSSAKHSAIILVAGGTITNRGLVTSPRTAVAIENAVALVTNFGTIRSTSTGTNGVGVYLDGGGRITNEAGGLVTAYDSAIATEKLRVTVVNDSTISNTGSGHSALYLGAGGNVVNGSTSATKATISSAARGGILVENAAATVTNFGTIESTAPLSGTVGSGVYLQVGGTITNKAGGTIAALRNAVTLGGTVATHAAALVTNSGLITGNVGIGTDGTGDTGANRVVNYGTITGTGGTAVAFGAGSDVFIEEAGGVVNGAIVGGAGNDIFEFAAGSLTASDTISGGSGTDTLWFTTAGTIAAASFTHVTGIDAIHLAAGTNSLTLSNALVADSDAERLTVEGGTTNTINAAAVTSGKTVVFNDDGAADTVTGSRGTNIYEFDNKAGGALTINNAFGGGTAAHGDLEFKTSLSDQDLWLLKSGNNLVAEVLGTAEKVTLDGWYGSNASAQVKEITAGGKELDSGLAALVQAMATFQADNPAFNPTAAHTTMPGDATLQNAIAAAWHS